jgi:hypothetical protein
MIGFTVNGKLSVNGHERKVKGHSKKTCHKSTTRRYTTKED